MGKCKTCGIECGDRSVCSEYCWKIWMDDNYP